MSKLEMPIEDFAIAVSKENARLNAEIERLRAALEPFALVVPFDFAADDEPVLMRIKASAFRRARAELEAKDA
jgi:hypothetical protein